MKPRKQAKFYDAHSSALILFEAAQRYFKEQNVKPGFSISEWNVKRAKLQTERSKVYSEYTAQKDKFEGAYSIRREAENILRDLNRPQQQRSTRDRGTAR